MSPIRRRFRPSLLPAAMEIKFELDINKAARATAVIGASYSLRCVFEGTKYTKLAFANFVPLIIIHHCNPLQ
jgi:hypothetical protein